LKLQLSLYLSYTQKVKLPNATGDWIVPLLSANYLKIRNKNSALRGYEHFREGKKLM
jgi:hypothetical protein